MNNNANKFRVDGSVITTLNDLTTYNAHANGILNNDGGLKVHDNGVNKFIVLSTGNVFCKAPKTTQSFIKPDL